MTVDAELDETRDAVVAEMEIAVVELRSVLDAERQALDCADSIALDAATATKAQLLQRLESLDAERRQLVDIAPPHEPSAAWRNIRRQLDDCRRVNAINGSIVEHQLHGVRRALGILRGSGEGPPVLYGPGGHAQAQVPPRSLSKA
ncbi:MAG TPA: flagellar protein FlgN [Rhodanobacteraceae bacterium]|nr:flagellar protein FlgN [Rhodanobacteraceae bacterium]